MPRLLKHGARIQNENSKDSVYMRKGEKKSKKTDHNSLFLSNRNNSIAGELMQVDGTSPMS